MKTSAAEIEDRLKNELGLAVQVEPAESGLLVTGLVATAEDRAVALDFVRSLADGAPVADVVEIVEPDIDAEIAEAGDFTDQVTLTSPDEAAGPTNSYDDNLEDGNRVYVPPMDPVATNTEVLNGFALSSEEGRSDTPLEGEMLADAVREALRLDSLTAGFPIEVEVDGDEVTLTGAVGDIEDAEYVEGVVGAVPGVGVINERLTVGSNPHSDGEHRPGEPTVPSGRLEAEAPRNSGGAVAGAREPVSADQPNDDRAGGGRPYGSSDVTRAFDASEARDWAGLLAWLEHPTGIAETARAGMVEDFCALRDAGVPMPQDPGALFEAAMIARTEDPERARERKWS